jgi:hypothetical protein
MKTRSVFVRPALVAMLLACFVAPAAWAQANAAVADPVAEPTVLRFRDFYQSPVGPAGLQMSAALRQAHGQRVRLTGYMVTQEAPLNGHFFLTPLPVSMSSHADGDADDLPPATALVLMPPAEQAQPVLSTPGLLQLTGQLQVGRFEMPDGRIVWVRLLLEPRPSLSPGNTALNSPHEPHRRKPP